MAFQSLRSTPSAFQSLRSAFGFELRRSSRISAQGLYPGYQKEKGANAESVGESDWRSWPTLSAFAGSLDGLPQGCRYAPTLGWHSLTPSAFQSLRSTYGVLESTQHAFGVPEFTQHAFGFFVMTSARNNRRECGFGKRGSSSP